MIKINNAKNVAGERVNLSIESETSKIIDATHLTIFPGLIDPHVHFRVPGQEYKEDWRTAALASIRGGYTTVFDMPNNIPACVTQERLQQKKQTINNQLADAGIPLNYQLFFGADKNNFQEIPKIKNDIIGIKVFMGSSTGDLLMDDDSSLHAIFAIASAHDLLIAVHAEDECLIQQRTKKFIGTDFTLHSKIRSPEIAARAVEKAISLSKMYGTRLYILHVSSASELNLIKNAKKAGTPVFAEVCPHHLFLNDAAYSSLKGRAQMNPPLRSESDRLALFDAIHDGIIDTVGSDHAPHTTTEKDQPFGKAPSGVPGIETTFPLLLNAHHQNLLSLDEIQRLTSKRAKNIFRYSNENCWVLADLNKTKIVDEKNLKTKCAWSPYAGMKLTGWPVYTILNNQLYDLELSSRA